MDYLNGLNTIRRVDGSLQDHGRKARVRGGHEMTEAEVRLVPMLEGNPTQRMQEAFRCWERQEMASPVEPRRNAMLLTHFRLETFKTGW